MPTVLDRPEAIDTRPPELREPPPLEPTRSRRWLRWMGWLLVAGAVALVVYLVIDANRDDGSTATPVTTSLPASAITADPKPRTPVAPVVQAPDVEPRLGFGEEATITPQSTTRLVKHAPGYIAYPETTFMEEATLTPLP
jgi:hypothetical protein